MFTPEQTTQMQTAWKIIQSPSTPEVTRNQYRQKLSDILFSVRANEQTAVTDATTPTERTRRKPNPEPKEE